MKGILGATAVAALASWVITAEQSWYCGFATWLLVMALPVAALAIAVEGHGVTRRFCTGALVPLCLPLFFCGQWLAQVLLADANSIPPVPPEGIDAKWVLSEMASDHCRRVLYFLWPSSILGGVLALFITWVARKPAA